jgi:hypothetical protein
MGKTKRLSLASPSNVAQGVRWRLQAIGRAHPDFMIIGAQKCGTTSLFDYVSQHEFVLPPRKKEIRFFCQHWERGLLWYRWNFPKRSDLRRRVSRAITGEASPDYLPHPDAPRRAAAVVPEARLVVVLRHPVDRAYSQYHWNMRLGTEDRDFEEAMVKDLDLVERERQCGTIEWTAQRNYHSYVLRSQYHPQLMRWFAYFPRSAFHILTFESLLSEPRAECNRVIEYLGLPQHGGDPTFRHLNSNPYKAIDPALRASLTELFIDDIKRTERLLGRQLGYTRAKDAGKVIGGGGRAVS